MTLNEVRLRRILLTLGEVQKKLDDLSSVHKDMVISLISKSDISYLRERLDTITDEIEHMMR